MSVKILKNISTFIFCGIMFLTCFALLCCDFNASVTLLDSENIRKKLSVPPQQYTVWDLPQKFDNFFNYKFPFRRYYLLLNNRLQYFVLNSSPTEEVVIGKNGWLFNGKPFPVIAQGKLLYEKWELRNLRTDFISRYNFFKQKNIDYLLFIVPDKETVYPERYAGKYQPLAERTRYDQLVDYLRATTEIPVIYPKEYIRAAAQQEKHDLYFKYDAHWNDIGAFYGYTALIEKIKEKYPYVIPLTADQFEIKNDLGAKAFSRMLGVGRELEPIEPAPFMLYKGEKFYELQDIRTTNEMEATSSRRILLLKNTCSNCKKETLIPRVVIWGDSFMQRLKQYMVANAAETILVPHSVRAFNVKTIEKYHPNLVIDELLARHLTVLKKSSERNTKK